MEIFKYAGTHGIKILESCQLKVCDPRSFNDPFEFCPQAARAITAADVEAKFGDVGFLTNVYEKNREIRDKCPSVAEFLNSIEKDKTRWVEFFLKKFSDADKFPPDKFAEIAARYVGVICFSQTCDDILMWSHYANYHCGMVIEFDANYFGIENLDPVEYGTERPIYNPVFDIHGFEHLVRVTRRKSDHWAYEKEVRLLVDWDTTKEITVKGDEKMRTLPFSPTAIRRVVLGCMTQEPLVHETKNVLGVKNFNHVRLQRMLRDLRSYKLHPVDL